MPHRIELASDEQAQIIHRLMVDADSEAMSPDPPIDAASETIDDERRRLAEGGALIAWDGLTPVACLQYAIRGDHLSLTRLVVLPSQQPHDLGTRLLQAAEALAARRGLWRVRLRVRMDLAHAVDRYVGLGYARESTHPHPGGTSLVGSLVKGVLAVDPRASLETHCLSNELRESRRSIRAALHLVRTIPDDELNESWLWDGSPLTVREAVFLAIGQAEQAELAVESALRRGGATRAEGGRILAFAADRLGELMGLLDDLGDDDLDREPGGSEWTIRRTLGHVIQVLHSYTWRPLWSVHRARSSAELPLVAPSEWMPPEAAREEEAAGTLSDLKTRLLDRFDAGIELLGPLNAQNHLQAASVWAEHSVDVSFRLRRWSQHLLEHTIQVKKILQTQNYRPSEVQRLARRLTRATWRLEGATYGAPASSEVDEIVRSAGHQILQTARAIAPPPAD